MDHLLCFAILFSCFELNSLDPHFLLGWTIPLRPTCHIIHDWVAQSDPQCNASRHAVYKTQKQTNEERKRDGLKLRRDCEDGRERPINQTPPTHTHTHSENKKKTKSAAVKPTAQLQSSIYTRTRLLERWQSRGLGCNQSLPLSKSPEVSFAMFILTSKHCIGLIHWFRISFNENRWQPQKASKPIHYCLPIKTHLLHQKQDVFAYHVTSINQSWNGKWDDLHSLL